MRGSRARIIGICKRFEGETPLNAFESQHSFIHSGYPGRPRLQLLEFGQKLDTSKDNVGTITKFVSMRVCTRISLDAPVDQFRFIWINAAP